MSTNSIRRMPVWLNGSRLSKETETAQQHPQLYKWSGQQNTKPRRQTERHAFMALLKAKGITASAVPIESPGLKRPLNRLGTRPKHFARRAQLYRTLLQLSDIVLSLQYPLRRDAAWPLISALNACVGRWALQERNLLRTV
ncbi:hypothetical protein PMIN01_10564 [Paraphaeosphaeria minitans]|uniref:Uncharacterized protein n=1 Tax=Paraphaeosphaeria minitans TaxID=565426 RepID=A0A9P6G9T3_9PLEO|nr:hypothetical protein PMIN01_10564 [Paraphaeosphaeria minitans]